jgi:hypothetical protein
MLQQGQAAAHFGWPGYLPQRRRPCAGLAAARPCGAPARVRPARASQQCAKWAAGHVQVQRRLSGHLRRCARRCKVATRTPTPRQLDWPQGGSSMAMLALPHRLRSFVSLDEHHPSTQGISPTFRPPSLCAFRYACGSAISESELIVFHRQIPTSPPMSLPTPAAPTGNRFAVVTETDYGAPIFIAALISSIFTFLVLIVRIAFVKWHRCGLDNLILVCAKVSLMRSPPA